MFILVFGWRLYMAKCGLFLTEWVSHNGANVPKFSVDYPNLWWSDFTGNMPPADPNALIIGVLLPDATAETLVASETCLNDPLLECENDGTYCDVLGAWLNETE